MSCEAVLSPRQRAFVALLASGKNQEQAAQVLGVQARTCRRWFASPVVRAALARAQDEALGDVCRRMSAGASDMLDVLQAVARDGDMPAGVRVRAALGWLDTMFKTKELLELVERIGVLEKTLEKEAKNEEERRKAVGGH